MTYGSGGTIIDVWVQTSIGGTSWTDIANFHWTTSGHRQLFNLSSATPITAQYTPTDGTLTANTCKDGVLATCTAPSTHRLELMPETQSCALTL